MRAIDATPDITLAELRERLITERGETFALSTIHDFYRRHRITFKKRRRTPASKRARSRLGRTGLGDAALLQRALLLLGVALLRRRHHGPASTICPPMAM